MSQFGNSFNCLELVEEAEAYIRQNFSKIAKTKHFLKLNYDELTRIIQCDELNVSSEENIFESCIIWIKSDETRIPMLPKLLANIRLPLLSLKYIIQQVQTEDLIRKSFECRDLVDEAKDYHLLCLEGIKSNHVLRRRNYFGQIYILGGHSNKEYLNTLEIYDSNKETWSLGYL